ncbi:MAG TPA: tRNA-dihydrouridine synthase family protein [Draconibacterium sp.]|nr:tRNA-dihydrouridine synthase family protein [Draconibacterium sp.]
MNKNIITYIAPIQGFTDFVYRKAFDKTFPGTDAFFIPYIILKNEQILKKYEKEILPENNPQKRAVPQVLVKNGAELVQLSKLLSSLGYTEVNLNMGCPYPMVTNRGKGAGLLPFPDQLKRMLDNFYERSNMKLSVKMRAGLHHPNEVEQIIPILNEFPIAEIIFHPRIAKQLYKGEILKQTFIAAGKQSRIPLVYNGDIFSLTDFTEKQHEFATTENWMLGRGVLKNPFLPSEIKAEYFPVEEKRKKRIEFHKRIFEGYSESMDNPGNALNKMKQFWSYFCYSFPNPQKTFKKIKKTSDLNQYQRETNSIFNENRDGN